jgi:hypothetical protein
MKPGVIGILVVVFCSCALFDDASDSSGPTQPTNQTHGYALLYDLMSSEKDVSKVLIIKRERAELRDLIRDIAQRCRRASKELEQFARADRSLNLKDRGLPSAEVETRSAISQTKAKQLITESGKEFELRLLIAQQEALTYGSHLATVIAKTESNAGRAEFLRQLSTDLTTLENRLSQMLLGNYNWAAK